MRNDAASAGRLLAVNVVHELIRGPTRWTAIDKRPVDGPVTVGHRPGHGVTLAEAFDPTVEGMQRLRDAGIDLAEPLRGKAERTIRRG